MSEKPFRTKLDPPVETITPSGEKEEEVIALRLTKDGREEFYVKGKTNVYEKIQAFAEDCKIENIIKRCIDLGSVEYLNQVKGFYTDISEMPNNLIEAHQKIKEAEEFFNMLPVKTREKYDNNFNKYLADIGSEEFMKTLGITKEEVKEEIKETTKESEVKENE